MGPTMRPNKVLFSFWEGGGYLGGGTCLTPNKCQESWSVELKACGSYREIMGM